MVSVGGSKAFALLLVGMMAAAGLVAATAARAEPAAPSIQPDESPITTPVSPAGGPESGASAPDPTTSSPLGKIAPALQDPAKGPRAGAYVEVMIHTLNVPALGKVLESVGAQYSVPTDGAPRVGTFVARPWGAVGVPESIRVQVPESALLPLAALPYVQYVDTVTPATTMDEMSPVFAEEQAAFEQFKARIAAGEKIPGPRGTSAPDVSPTSWAIAREHKAYDAWNMGFEGQGVNVAVIDTGEDFGNPSLADRWAVDPIVGSPWEGWPIMFHPASMEALMSPQFWTKFSDLDRTALPFWEASLDDNSWYSNMDYVANDTNSDGLLEYRDGTTNPLSLQVQRTPFANPQRYGNWNAGYNSPIGRSYRVGCAGVPGPCVLSQSGKYRLGVARDDQLTALWGEKVGILLVDATTPYVYDTAYVDLNFDQNFTNDKALTKADPLAVADLTGDGVQDISGGLLYFIASSSPVPRDVVIPSITGAETNATLANGALAVNVTGDRLWQTPARLYVNDGATDYYLPGVTEDITESITLSSASTQGGRWPLGGPPTFGIASRTAPRNAITGQAVNTAKLLRGPGTDFSLGLVYDISDDVGPLFEFVDYQIDMATGEITFANNYPPGDTITVTYQIATYILEPVSGLVSFLAPLPVGWSLWATYEKGLPIPYSQEYGPAHGYDTFIPANGQLVAFHGDFDRESHGTFVTSTIAAHPFGNRASSTFEIFGTAPQARVIGIAACCNVAGSLGILASIEDQRTFAAVGYDGIPGTGDEAVILSNSFGDPDLRNTGFTFEDRWLIDFSTRYPGLTTLVALGNNGPGYGTSAPGGSSPGVIGVGAGTSQDYRIQYGNDLGGGYYVLPDCPPPPIDPKDCTDRGGSAGGPGPFGDVIYFSSRGPTLMGTPKPDIVSIGGYAVEAGPLNVFASNPASLNGNLAFSVFGNTSQATPVTAGVSALIAQAYRLAHGTMPTNVQLRSLLKSGADDMHKDILQQGAGWTNALRSVRSALDGIPGSNGVTSDTDYWVPGGYGGTHRVGFVNFLPAGQSDAKTITLTNHDFLQPVAVSVKAQVYQLAAPAFRYPFALAPGIEEFLVLKANGTHDDRGVANVGGPSIDFQPYWNTSDFVKVTLAYNASAYTAATSLRIDTFDWYDSNFNGRFDQDGGCLGFGVPQHGCRERNRMTVDAPGGGANSVWDAIHSPGARVHNGLGLNVRSGAGAAIPATLIVEFYQRVDWPWVTTDIPPPGTIPLTANGGTASFTVTASIPPGTPAGLYEGALYVDDAGNMTTIPIAITVPVSDFPLVLGGNVPATSLYDNSGVVQGTRDNGPWQQIADNRYVWGDFSPIASRPGRHIIYNAIMEGPNSDPEWFVYQLAPDAAWTDASRFGPGTMNLLSQTADARGVTSTAYPNREFRSTLPGVDTIGGLVALQVKAWNAWAEEEPFAANVGIMQVFPNNVSVVTNKVVGTTFVSVWSNVPLYDGLAATKTNTSGQTMTNQFVNQTAPADPYTASYTKLFTLANTASFVVDVTGVAGNIDLYIMRDAGPPNVFDAGDPIVCASASPTFRERCEVPQPPDGAYWVAVHGRSVPLGSTGFTLEYSITVGISDPNFSCKACPATTIPPYSASGITIEWRFPGDQPEGAQGGFFYLSPGYVPYGLVQLVNINWVYDVTPPTINPITDLSPAPGSVITDATAAVGANIGDLSDNPGQIDPFSIRLLVDGLDVTLHATIIAPFAPGADGPPPIPPGYIQAAIAWEHQPQPFTDGRHSAIITANDYAGNVASAVWSWTVDTTPPDLTIANPASDAITNQAQYPFVAWTDPGSTVTVRVNGVPANATVSPDGKVTATLNLPEGTSQVVVTSADALGNSASASRRITLDTVRPVISAVLDVYTPTNHVLTTVTGSVDERVSAVWVNGVPTSVGADGSFSAVVPLIEGPNQIVLATADAAGNTATKTLGPITRDTVAPTIVLQPFPEPLITDLNETTVEVSGTVPDADILFVTINGRPVLVDAQGQFKASFFLVVGDNTFLVKAEDNTGNAAQAVTSVAYAPIVYRDLPNYNSLIASGLAVVLLIVGFVVGFLLSGRGGEPGEEAPPGTPEAAKAPRDEEANAEDAPAKDPAASRQEEEL